MPNNKNIISPHDKYFRFMMSDPEIAGEFFMRYLPSDIKKIIDFNSIQQQKDSFISDGLKQRVVDLLFVAKFNNKPGVMYILIEHQSTQIKLMPFRMLEYMVAIMRQHLKRSRELRLPFVYPFVFYSGKRKYNYSTDLFDLFEDDKSFAMRHVMWQPYQMVDLSKLSDQELREGALCNVCVRVMKKAYEKDRGVLLSFLTPIFTFKKSP